MIIQLAIFWYWSNIVLPGLQKDYDAFEMHNKVCQHSLTITATYLLVIETSSVLKRKQEYLRDLTRIFNLITPTLILCNVYNVEARTEEYFWTIQSWGALAIWFRFLMYLRTIHHFSWVIRMISECFKDMCTFLVVFFIGVVAFGDAFLSIE